MGGEDDVSDCDLVTITTTGNATDFGDLTFAGGYNQAFSNSHGGLM
jgi:hypothetical protein